MDHDDDDDDNVTIIAAFQSLLGLVNRQLSERATCFSSPNLILEADRSCESPMSWGHKEKQENIAVQ